MMIANIRASAAVQRTDIDGYQSWIKVANQWEWGGGGVQITSWNPKFNGSHFDLPPGSIYKITGLGYNGENDDVGAQGP